MKFKLTAIAATGMMFTAFMFAPISEVMAKPAKNAAQNSSQLAQSDKKLLKNVPFSLNQSDGTVVNGRISITQFSYDPNTSQLLASGVLQGVISQNGNTRGFNQSFTNVPSTLSSNLTKQASCDILFLDLGPIFLDVLGLTVDLSEIVLDINAVPGSGNLLGNLLCSLVGLLDGGGLLQQILDVIAQINSLL